jgi:hypothetical protein
MTRDLTPRCRAVEEEEEGDGTHGLTARWRRATGIVQTRRKRTRLAPASTCRPNMWCDTWQNHFKPPAPPASIPPPYGSERDRWRYAPNAVRTPAEPMAEEQARRLLATAPKWKHASILFNDKYNGEQRLPFDVSKASVTRARERAEQAVPRPQSNAPLIWQRSDLETIPYNLQAEMLLDGKYDGTLATQRRAYSDEDLAMLSRWEHGLFSQVKHDSGPFMVRWTGKGGLVIEERPNPIHQRRQIRRYPGREVTDQDLDYAFSRMLWWARKINALIKNRGNAKTATGRAYQAAVAIRDYHRLRMGIDEFDIIAADIVIEAIGAHLRRAGRIDWWQRTVTLDLFEGASSYEAADRFGRDASSLRERYNAEVLAIEAKFGKYCNDLWEPPQKQSASGYNINKDRKSAPKPRLTERLLSPLERDALVLQYIEKASGPFLKWGYGDPLTWIRWRAGVRYAYKLIAGYLEDGGRILTGYAPAADLPEEWLFDRRSDARVWEEATGSFFREPGLDPFDGRRNRPRIVSDEARMMRVFAAAEMDTIVDDISGSP